MCGRLTGANIRVSNHKDIVNHMNANLFSIMSAAAPSGGASAMIMQILPLVAIFAIFYFLIIRPQQRQMKEHKAKIEAVKRNDEVVTGGGLVGKVLKVDDTYVEVDLGNGVKVKAVKALLNDVKS